MSQHDESISRLNVWIINDPEMGHLIAKVLKPEDLEYTFAIVMPNMEQPHNIMNHMRKWL